MQSNNSAVVSDGSQSESIAENDSTSNGTPSDIYTDKDTTSIPENQTENQEVAENVVVDENVTPESEETQPSIEVKVATPEMIAAEEQQIIAEAKANGTHLKAPNGKPTNLSQWVQVRTKAFKRWFGDWTTITFNEDGSLNIPEDVSKVVDANGEPMVVYHGSNWKGITTLRRWCYTTGGQLRHRVGTRGGRP